MIYDLTIYDFTIDIRVEVRVRENIEREFLQS